MKKPADASDSASIPVARSAFVGLSDEQLRSQCAIDTYRASGPGGQKRNKTSSAVRIRHLPTGLIVIAEESRSQHENRARALRRLREAFYLHLREECVEGTPAAENLGADRVGDCTRDSSHRLTPGGCGHPPNEVALPRTRKDPLFLPMVGKCLDALQDKNASVRDAADSLGTTTSQLVAFLALSPKAWQEANRLREQNGLKLLRQSN